MKIIITPTVQNVRQENRVCSAERLWEKEKSQNEKNKCDVDPDWGKKWFISPSQNPRRVSQTSNKKYTSKATNNTEGHWFPML